MDLFWIYFAFIFGNLLTTASPENAKLSEGTRRRRYERSVHTAWRRPLYAHSMLIAKPDRTEGLGEKFCSRGCMTCDLVNGCLRCRSRMFLHIIRSGNRQVGICLHQCPAGSYGKRGKRYNVCKKCEVANCKSCFTSTYCTSCQNKHYLYSAKCVKECPKSLIANNWTRSCEQKIDCVISPWSSWSKCARRSPSRSCKYGRKKRTRDIVQEPTENGKQCPKLKDTKKCRTPANKCPLLNNWIRAQIRRIHRKQKAKITGSGKKRRQRKDGNSRPKGNNRGLKIS